jgi:hypothetical protein
MADARNVKWEGHLIYDSEVVHMAVSVQVCVLALACELCYFVKCLVISCIHEIVQANCAVMDNWLFHMLKEPLQL